jgi:hypothetical protein
MMKPHVGADGNTIANGPTHALICVGGESLNNNKKGRLFQTETSMLE